ncbi:helix-turn-helix domain-containing protein [Marinibacterium profundimaris]|uniref:Fis family transcriptional regulator n=1 Tax=Marinibacterium profundimaris TaxID=1679460 RepID=A0A225NAE1_9RHOB|nr:helix-turn-helix transcriptional regulator [Marinibacterium profundimaris]OWU66791.1 Fis family transcriptional regulator [Marinibacterium profundimaris]
MADNIERGSVGSSFDDFLKEQGTLEETTAQAIKRVLAYQLAEAMKEKRISKVEMARKLATSRSQLDRLLDPEQDGVTLGTLSRAAEVLGRKLTVNLQ